MKRNIRNIIDIIKYSDNEPLELCVALTRVTLFPISAVACLYTPVWFLVFGIFTGIFQFWAVSTREIRKRHLANMLSLTVPVALLLSLIANGAEHSRMFSLFIIGLICLWNVWKTAYQIKKRGYRKYECK